MGSGNLRGGCRKGGGSSKLRKTVRDPVASKPVVKLLGGRATFRLATVVTRIFTDRRTWSASEKSILMVHCQPARRWHGASIDNPSDRDGKTRS